MQQCQTWLHSIISFLVDLLSGRARRLLVRGRGSWKSFEWGSKGPSSFLVWLLHLLIQPAVARASEESWTWVLSCHLTGGKTLWAVFNAVTWSRSLCLFLSHSSIWRENLNATTLFYQFCHILLQWFPWYHLPDMDGLLVCFTVEWLWLWTYSPDSIGRLLPLLYQLLFGYSLLFVHHSIWRNMDWDSQRGGAVDCFPQKFMKPFSVDSTHQNCCTHETHSYHQLQHSERTGSSCH